MRASEKYYLLTKKRHLFNIMPIENITSVMQFGILSHEKSKAVFHNSVAMPEIQERREKVRVPNGLKLHQYANIYFDARNPMMYKLREFKEKICVLAISLKVLDQEDVVITDRNASSDVVRFYEPISGIDHLDFQKIFSKYWTDEDYYREHDKKSKKCAEVLVPYLIATEFIVGAYVINETAKSSLKRMGFNKPIQINGYPFFL